MLIVCHRPRRICVAVPYVMTSVLISHDCTSALLIPPALCLGLHAPNVEHHLCTLSQLFGSVLALLNPFCSHLSDCVVRGNKLLLQAVVPFMMAARRLRYVHSMRMLSNALGKLKGVMRHFFHAMHHHHQVEKLMLREL